MLNSSPGSTGEQVNGSPYTARHAQIATAMYNAGLNALALNPGPSLTYLTGLHFHLMERPVVAFFTPHNPPLLVLPELEAAKTANLPFPVQVFTYGEDPVDWTAAFRQAITGAELDGRQVGVEPGRLRVLELNFLKEAAPEAQFVSAEGTLAALRMYKDEDEIASMRKAVQIAQQALLATLPAMRIGMSERELASELTMQVLRAGSDSELPFPPIVSGGPNSANPHATPSDRPLTPGELLVIDWGASYEGYFSDLTRTFAVGEVDAELKHIVEVVGAANAAGRAAARPGITAGEVDRAAREVIEAAGFGQFFIHRTGHGLGMEAHEEPYIRSGNPLILETGMSFTVEPGIYLTGRNGSRIEDDVVITSSGAESLSDLPRELITVGE